MFDRWLVESFGPGAGCGAGTSSAVADDSVKNDTRETVV